MTVKNSSRFFQNKECEYFPCHDMDTEEGMNCLFCFCPLYGETHCIGTPTYLTGAKGERIKDCSGCTVVHRAEMYDAVINRLGERR